MIFKLNIRLSFPRNVFSRYVFHGGEHANQQTPTTMLASAVLLSNLASSSAALFSNNTAIQTFMWEQFKREHDRTYSSEEEPKRFAIFLENLKTIDQRNAAEVGSAIHGINKFTDMSQEEFESRFLLSRPPAEGSSADVVEVEGAPTASLVDWSGKLTTPVKNQGYCGSCWAFSATEQIESDTMRTKGKTFVLSPEQIVDCDKTSSGCNGGWTENAYNYVKKAGGLETEANYPYSAFNGKSGSCNAKSSLEVVTVSGYHTIKGESSMASYVQKTGPLSVCVCAASWNSYNGGIMSTCGKRIDHCVQAVGVQASSGGYWKVRNSWGTSWGENGYIRLAYGQDTCGITNDPTYVDVVLK